MAIDAGGNIVLAGTANMSGGGYEFALARFTPAGTLDSTFGTGGTVLYDLGDQTNHATCLAIQADGGILVGGYDDNSGDWDLVGFLGDGSVDTSFGSNGQVALSGVNAQAGVVSSLAVQSNGQILAGGTFGGSNELGVVRINTDGTLDSSFGNAGFALDGMANSSVWDLALQPDGSILAAGFAGNAYEPGHSGNAPVLARLAAGDVAAVLVNVATASSPVLSLSGDSSATLGTAYTLAIGDGGSDLGSGSDVSYVVHWGDGQTTTVSADALVAQEGDVMHTYTAAPTSGGVWNITVDLVVTGDPDSPFTGIASQSVTFVLADATTTALYLGPPRRFRSNRETLTATASAPVVPRRTRRRYGRVLRRHNGPGAGNVGRCRRPGHCHAGYSATYLWRPRLHRGL